MRTISRLGRALVLAAFLPVVAAAQNAGAPIENSWFWGVGGGRISFPTYFHRVDAPTVSADWLITRQRWALDIYGSQAYFADSSAVREPGNTGALRRATINDMRRVGFQGIVFLPNWTWFRPYAGFGYSFNFVNKAARIGSCSSAAACDSVDARVNDARALNKATYAAGFMVTRGKFAPYAQYTLMPTKGSGKWLINGDGMSSFWEAGLRYNFGTAIEKVR